MAVLIKSNLPVLVSSLKGLATASGCAVGRVAETAEGLLGNALVLAEITGSMAEEPMEGK